MTCPWLYVVLPRGSLRFPLFKFAWVPEATGSHHLWAPANVHPGSGLGLSLSYLDHLAWWARAPRNRDGGGALTMKADP